jgi:hypothetical protein
LDPAARSAVIAAVNTSNDALAEASAASYAALIARALDLLAP